MNVYNEYTALKKADPTFDPVRRVASNPLSRLHADSSCYGFRLIDDLYTLDVNDLSSDVYMTMLLLLHRFSPPRTRAVRSSSS